MYFENAHSVAGKKLLKICLYICKEEGFVFWQSQKTFLV